MEEMNFSARAHDRIFKVSGTPDDLAGTQDIRPNDVLEAIQFRSLDWKSAKWIDDLEEGEFSKIRVYSVNPPHSVLAQNRRNMGVRH